MSRLSSTKSQTPLSGYTLKFDILPEPTGLSGSPYTSSEQNDAIDHVYTSNNDWIWKSTPLHEMADGKHVLYSTPHMAKTKTTCRELGDLLTANKLTIRATIQRNERDSEQSIVQITPEQLYNLEKESQIGVSFASADEKEHGQLFLYATNGQITDMKYKLEQTHDQKLRFVL